MALGATVAACGALLAAGPASAYIYWSQNAYGADGSTISDQLYRATMNGKSARIMSNYTWWADSLALAGRMLYFDPAGPGAAPGIGRIGIDGSGLEATSIQSFGFHPFLAGNFMDDTVASDGQLATDGAHLYWMSPQPNGSGGYVEAIGRANLDGSGIDRSFITLPAWGGGTTTGGGSTVATLAIGGGEIYWSEPDRGGGGTIGRASLNGTGVSDAFIQLPPGHSAGDLSVDAGHVYWVDTDSNAAGASTIGRANADGSGIATNFITPTFGALNGPQYGPGGEGLAVDAHYIYWGLELDYGPGDLRGAVDRANLDGSGAGTFFTTSGPVTSLAVDGLDGSQVPLVPANSRPGGSPVTKRCVVPKLKGASLGRAKTLLRHAGCRLGTVTRHKAAKKSRGKVIGQGVRAGRHLAYNSKVSVTLGK